jgi:hypothetical protein
MRKRVPLIAAAIARLAFLIWFFALRGGGGGKKEHAPAPTAASDPWAKPAVKTPDRSAAPQPGAPIFLRDADPVGGLRLEGQVLDADDRPVAGAEVWLGSVPPKSTRSQGDGSFAFDKLVGRVYELEARKGDDVGGPIAYTLTSASDPAIVHVRHGVALTVIVTSSRDGAAVPNAQVELRGLGDQRASTGADGKAVLHGVAPGWIALAISASGFAPAHELRQIKDGDHEVAVQLERGAAVAGKVIDERGAPIAHARVLAREVADLFPLTDATKDGVTTADDGTFTIPSVAAGSYRFVATDDEHAPGSSEPITVDGATRTGGVTITMRAAAVLAGRVITKDQQPAPYATIKVQPKDVSGVGGMEAMAASSRQVVADQDGHFTIRGLPRAAVRVRAESDAAASNIADVDLSGAPPTELVLILDVSGTIAGVVVDGDNQPIAEAQVTSIGDLLGGGAKVEDLGMSGFTSATTDGGGHFAMHGLPEGAYRLWAHRAGGTSKQFDSEGTRAHTGDTSVKITLPTPGGVKGTVALDDGTPVKVGVVETGRSSEAAISGGAFELDELVPGSYDLRLKGPDFAELTKGDVEVAAGKVTDLGAITVHRGRKVTGRVVAADGSPGAGAKVELGRTIIADGKGLGLGGVATDEQLGVRSTIAGDDGAFAIVGVGPEGGAILADQPNLGRSDTLTIPPGTDDPPPITMRLHAFGSLGGHVTANGQPVASATLTVSSANGGSSMIIVTTGADGSYLIERLPEGTYHANVMRNAGLGASTAGADATVAAGQRATLDIDIKQGDVTLTVEVRGKAGAVVNAAEIMVMAGTVNATNGQQLQDAFLHGKGNGGGGVKFWLGGPDFPAFDKLVAGPYSVCTLPITGNLADPKLANALQSRATELAVYCAPYVVTATPAQQRFVHEVPAMKPLPPPT